MRNFYRLYLLEILVVAAGLAVIGGVYLLFGYALNVDRDKLAYASVASTGMLFIVGHIYSRLKDRRDGTRKRAHDLFVEWHSREIRESRIFVSRWIEVHGIENIQSLSILQTDAATAYHRRYGQSLIVATSTGETTNNPLPHALDDVELKEFHFFKIYQFFERWAQLVKNADIDQRVASDYMSSYKSWYLSTLIEPLANVEYDQYIKLRLDEILSRTKPDH